VDEGNGEHVRLWYTYGMESIDIRWKQRLTNYGKALENLVRAVQLANTRTLSEMERRALQS